MTCNALLAVEKICHAVTSVLEHAVTASKGVHMKCANTHAGDLSFVRTAAKRRAVSPAHLVLENAVDAALTKSAPDAVFNRVIHAPNRAPGVALITNVITFVERSATALGVMPPVPRSSLAATHVLVCVERTVPQCVPFAMLKSFLLC